MSKRLTVSAKVLRRAKQICEQEAAALDAVLDTVTNPRPLPVVSFLYPRRGTGNVIERFVRVTEMNDTHLRGFQIRNQFDEEPGVPKTFLIERIVVDGVHHRVQLLHFAKEVE